MFNNFMPIEPEAYKKAKLFASTTTETKTVVVTLILHGFLTHPFVPGKLAFTQELDYLNFNIIYWSVKDKFIDKLD